MDPSVATFREKVAPVLGDAQTGLRFAAESDAQEAAQNVGFLQEDAGRIVSVVGVSPDVRASVDDQHAAVELAGQSFRQHASGKAGADDQVVE